MAVVGTRAGTRLLFPELVGRDEEIATITELVGVVASGESAVLLISGEAGLGKSALAKRITEIARRATLRVLRGDSVRFEIRRPFGPFVEMLGSAGLPTPDVGERLVGISIDPGPSVDRYRAHAAYVRTFRNLAAERPVVILLEDLHWADDASLELFAYLAQRLARGTLLVGTYRPEEVTDRPALRRALHDVPRDRTHQLDLSPLTATDVGRALRLVLQGARIGRDTRELLQARCGGNPLVLEEVLKALAERGDVSRVDGVWHVADLRDVPVPRSVRDAVHDRFRAVDGKTQQVLWTAAVIGDRFTFELLAEATNATAPALVAALRDATRAQLVVEIDSAPNSFSFRHALTREAILDELLERQQVELHAAVASAIERMGGADGAPDALAYHFDRAGDREKAFTYHERAAIRAEASLAFADALTHYERALELAPLDSDAVGDLELKIVGLADMLGEGQRAMRTLRPATQRLEAVKDNRRLALALLLFGRVAYHLGLPPEQRTVVPRALELLEPLGDTRELVMALAVRAFDLAIAEIGNVSSNSGAESALTVARRALAVAERLGSAPELAIAHDRIGIALVARGQFAAAIQHHRKAVAIAEAHAPTRLISSLNNLSIALAQAAGAITDESRALQVRMQTLRERYGRVEGHSRRLHEVLGEADWDEYVRFYSDHEGDMLEWAHLRMHWTFVRTAREGPSYLPEIASLRARMLASGARDYVEPATCHAAEILIIAAEYRPALDVLEPAFSLLARTTYVGTTLPSAAIYAVIAARAIRDDTVVRRWIQHCAWMQAREPEGLIGTAIDCTARYLAAEERADAGDLDEAITILHEILEKGAGELLRDDAFTTPNPVLSNLIALRYVELLLARANEPDRETAEAALARVFEFYRRAGARWYLERLSERADAWQLKVPRVKPTKHQTRDMLTPREREVALLVARGITNKEIAARLSVSVRTAESHVEQIRSKLGFHSRAQIAAWATRASAN